MKFLKNRDNPDAFEPVPSVEDSVPATASPVAANDGVYTIEISGKAYVVRVTEGGDVAQLTATGNTATSAPAVAPTGVGTQIPAPLSGDVLKVLVNVGDRVAEGDVILILEAMKMETEIRSQASGQVTEINVKAGDAVKVGDSLMVLA